jgi:hypothetical protein
MPVLGVRAIDQASLVLERAPKGAKEKIAEILRPSALQRPAQDLCLLFRLPSGAINLVDDCPAVGEALERFVAAGYLAEGRRLLAHSMDKRDAVWWGYLSAREAIRHRSVEPDHIIGLEAARAWINDPTDANRARCKAAIAACGTTSMAGILCFAVWLSGGSISPTPLRHVEPKPHLCGKLCAVVVYLASVHFDAGRYRQYLRHFLSVGTEIAQGACPWM